MCDSKSNDGEIPCNINNEIPKYGDDFFSIIFVLCAMTILVIICSVILRYLLIKCEKSKKDYRRVIILKNTLKTSQAMIV